MSDNLSFIRDNYLRILERINNASMRSDRNVEDVKLIVVTKHQPVEKILKICENGVELLGENYPEETDKKIIELAGRISPTWHMIGHIQSRKIKYLVRNFKMVHSIDRFEVAEKLNNACLQADMVMPVLLEVNLTGEESKFGYSVAHEKLCPAFYQEIEKIKTLGQLQLQGLMTMPPLINKPDENRKIFTKLHSLLEDIGKVIDVPEFKYLSMGTSQDFEIAIEEGATHIRIGEAIMGKRSSNS